MRLNDPRLIQLLDPFIHDLFQPRLVPVRLDLRNQRIVRLQLSEDQVPLLGRCPLIPLEVDDPITLVMLTT